MVVRLSLFSILANFNFFLCEKDISFGYPLGCLVDRQVLQSYLLYYDEIIVLDYVVIYIYRPTVWFVIADHLIKKLKFTRSDSHLHFLALFIFGCNLLGSRSNERV